MVKLPLQSEILKLSYESLKVGFESINCGCKTEKYDLKMRFECFNNRFTLNVFTVTNLSKSSETCFADIQHGVFQRFRSALSALHSGISDRILTDFRL